MPAMAARSRLPSPMLRRRPAPCSASGPERVRIEVSGNIIKNVKSVIVPHTGSMHGIAAAAAAGIIADAGGQGT